MPTNIKILSPAEIDSFDQPPILNASDRKYLFRFTKAINNVVKSFRTPRNKISFVLQLGYFKATNKFFSATDFKKSEIDFVCQDFGVPPESISFDQYDDTTLRRHKKITLELLGIYSFTDQSRDLLL